MKTILAVDDEDHILELLSYNLIKEGFQVIKASRGEDALKMLEECHVDMAILDWMLPGIDGLQVLKNIRMHERYKKMPVMMLTAKGDEISKVVGFEIGADDYLAKPFGIHELTARVKALFRRTSSKETAEEDYKEERIAIENIEINKTRRTVTVDGTPAELSLKEFDLLYFLSKNRGIVFSRDVLLEKIWGYDYLGETRTVDVHVRNLRKKIEQDDTNPDLIRTVRGVGYKMK